MAVVTSRVTRLVRAANLRAFREAIITLACEGSPLLARDRLVIVPTRAAAAHLIRSIERRVLHEGKAIVLPLLATTGEIVRCFGERVPAEKPLLVDAEREVLLSVACRQVAASGMEPPFRLRPALIAEMLELYDTLRRNQKDVPAFERLALARLAPGAEIDRGARRLVRQTQFLAAAFAEFERHSAACGLDEHMLRQRLLAERAARPIRHAIVSVSDRAFDRHGLHAADWDLLARVPDLERLDVVTTDGVLAGAFHERIHTLLPGIEETRVESGPNAAPALLQPHGGGIVHTARDREDEVAGFARRAKRGARLGRAADRIAIVVQRPLPYVYLAREVLRSGGVPCQMFDALPLAAEPYAAALDLLLKAVAANFTRPAALALLRSPIFRFAVAGKELDPSEMADLDRALRSAGFHGGVDVLERLVATWSGHASSEKPGAPRAGAALLALARELAPLGDSMPAAAHLTVLGDVLVRYERAPGSGPFAARHLRARAAVLGAIGTLRDAYARFDQQPVGIDEVAALIRRRIEIHTFAPRTGKDGVHLVDAEAARFGDFELVQLAGLVDGEWPDRPRRNIFYSPEILRDLGWPSERERRDSERVRFADLLQLPSELLALSTFRLDGDTLVNPSPLLDDVDAAAHVTSDEPLLETHIFEHEALGLEPLALEALTPFAREWGGERARAGNRRGERFRGSLTPREAGPQSVSALERYQDCPFAFFSAHVLRLEEEPSEESGLSPRDRGRLIHDVLRRFYEAWDANGGGAITPSRLAEARTLFITVAETLLGSLSDADASLERMRLFGSAVATGVIDTLLSVEIGRTGAVAERWLERRIDGPVALDSQGRTALLTGVADRIDLLPGRRLRVFDYKSGVAPDPRRALQVPLYAIAAQQRLEQRDARPWAVDEAAYVPLTGGRKLAAVVKEGAIDSGAVLESARARVAQAIDAIERGEFPARPYDPAMCRVCAFSTVCRKDAIGDE